MIKDGCCLKSGKWIMNVGVDAIAFGFFYVDLDDTHEACGNGIRAGGAQ